MDIKETILKQMDKQDIPRCTSEVIILNALDSIDLVNFVMDLEEALAEEHNIHIKLVSNKAFGKNSPFASPTTLIQYIEELASCQEKPIS